MPNKIDLWLARIKSVIMKQRIGTLGDDGFIQIRLFTQRVRIPIKAQSKDWVFLFDIGLFI